MTAPTRPHDPMRRAAEMAAAELLELPLDATLAGSFSFEVDRASDRLRLQWKHFLREATAVPSEVVTIYDDGSTTTAVCARHLPLADTREQAPAIAAFLDFWADVERTVTGVA